MVTNHLNHDYVSSIPISVADRYYGQDRARDFWHSLERAGRALYDFYGQSNVLISGGVVSQGSSVTKINVTAAVALGAYTVTVPDSFAALPPTAKTVTLPAVLIDMTAQVDFNLTTAGATLDGTTTNYLKLKYAEADGNTRSYAKKSGSYVYERQASFTLTCDSTAVASDEVLLATITGDGSTTLTVTKQVMPKNAQTLRDQVCPVGTLRYEPKLVSPSESYPWICLDTIDSGNAVTVSTTNWDAEFISYLRGVQSIYHEGRSSAQPGFIVTAWSIASNVATLTMSSGDTATKAFMAVLMEAQAAFGTYTGWMSITLPSAIGSIAAGDYAITSVSSTSIVFAYTAANGGASGSWTVNSYPFRVAGSSTTARIYGGSGVSMMSVNGPYDLFFAGIPRRGYFQGHVHGPSTGTVYLMGNGVATTASSGGSAGVSGTTANTGVPITDGPDGTPRYGLETHSPSLPGHLYMYGRNYLS